MPNVYHYHPETGEYIGASEADESPLEPGVYFIPGYATDAAPPEPEAGMARVWDGTQWAQVEDHRGETVYDTTTGRTLEVDTLGPLPETATTIAPATQHDEWDGAQWVTPVEAVRQDRWDQLRAENSGHIYLTYDEAVQSTLNALATRATRENNDAAAAELQRAWDWIGQVLGYYYQVKAQLMAATTVPEVEAVAWDFATAVPAPADPVRIDVVVGMLAE